MGAGRKARVMAVSLTALRAAITEVPTSCPFSSTTTIPSLSSWFLISTAFSVLAVAGRRLTGGGGEESALTYSGEGDEALDHHLGVWAPGASSLEEPIESHCNGAGSRHCCHIALHKPPSRHRLRCVCGRGIVKWV